MVNDFFKNRLVSTCGKNDDIISEKAVKSAIKLSQLGISSDKELKDYLYVKKVATELRVPISDEDAFDISKSDLTSKNNVYYLIVKSKLKSKSIIKLAYPNPGLSSETIEEEVDLNKWLELVRQIYNAVERKEMTKQNALDYYSNYLDKDTEEDLRFKKWFEHYSSGEHLKYSSKEEEKMKKESLYMGDLGQGNNPYYAGSGSAYIDKNTGNNMPGDSFGKEEVSRPADADRDRDQEFNAWQSRLHGAIRRIDKLIRSKNVPHDQYRSLAEHLLNLSDQVHSLRLASTLSDVTYKTASVMSKAGQKEAGDLLMKLAQEIPQAPDELLDAAPEAAAPEAAAPEAAAPEAAAPEAAAPEAPKPTDAIPDGDDVEPAKLKDIIPIPGPSDNEYEALAGDVSLEDAAGKLDEVAGMLADRRIIRQLAEFDIMLDKVGIASMFPELAESQSKLIDAFSYALTRVTKMMGQLSNARALVQANASIPGARAEEDAPEEEALPPEEELGQGPL